MRLASPCVLEAIELRSRNNKLMHKICTLPLHERDRGFYDTVYKVYGASAIIITILKFHIDYMNGFKGSRQDDGSCWNWEQHKM